jgi:hypothetical protein
MKNLKFLLVLLCMICLWSCSLTDNPEDSFQNNYFPLYVGNYWIFERVAVDANNNAVGEVFRDSLAVTAVEMIDGINTFQIKMYRQGLQTEVANICVKNSRISLYNKALMPFLYGDTSDCWSKLPVRWINLFHFNANIWRLKDSATADSIPTSMWLPDSSGLVKLPTATILNILAEGQIDGTFQIDSKQYKTANFTFSGNRILRLNDIYGTKFPEYPGYKFLDNQRAWIKNEFNITISLTENIGLSKILIIMVYGPDSEIIKYSLIKYKLN